VKLGKMHYACGFVYRIEKDKKGKDSSPIVIYL